MNIIPEIDCGQVQDVFCAGLGRIENLGSVSRLTLFVPKQYADGRTYCEATIALVIPNDQLAKIGSLLLQPPDPPAQVSAERDEERRLN